MTAKSIIDVYLDRPFHITIAKLGMTVVYLLKHQKVGEVATARKEIVHIKKQHFYTPLPQRRLKVTTR